MLVGIGVDVLEVARVRREGKAIGGSTQVEIAADEDGFPTLALTLFHTRDHAIACVVAASRGA